MVSANLADAIVTDAWRPRSAPRRLVPAIAETVRADLSAIALPAVDRVSAELTVLDITKWFGETSGGVRTYLHEKARYVAAREALRHVLVVPGPFDGYALGDGVRTYRLRGPRIPTQTAYRFLFATRTTRRILRHEAPSIIEVGSPFLVPWVTAFASRGLGVPLVAFHHTSLAGHALPPRRPAQLHNARTRGLGAYLRRLNRLFSTTIVASDFAAEELRRVGIDRVSRIPLGVDLEHFHPSRREQRRATRRRFALPEDRPVVLYMGRLAPEKSLGVVLDAWPAVARATGAQLVIAGAGSAERDLRARAPHGSITWLPFLSDRERVARLHAAADVYLSPGAVETFGLSALEAMASGVPVVTPAAGGGGELVQRSQAGAEYEPGSPSDAARALLAVLGGEPRILGARGRAYAERAHAWSTVFDQLIDTYREVLAR